MQRVLGLFSRAQARTALCLFLLLIAPLAVFADVTLGGRTLLPADNLYQFEPYRSIAAEAGVRIVDGRVLPHNDLLNDLILQNYQWKSLIRESLARGEAPLWNPYLFGGVPFLAAGQHSALYPFSALYYALPIESAYGWFQVSQLALSGLCMYALIRTLRMRRASALFAGLTYQLSGVLVVGAVHPMIVASAAWIPLILALVERVIDARPALRGRPATLPWAVLGAFAVAMQILAGHVEITIYAALLIAVYALVRLLTSGALRERRHLARTLGALALLGVGGAALASVQLLPLFELVTRNFRGAGRSTLEQVRSYAFPSRYIVMWLFPNLFGSSAAGQTYLDLFSGEWRSATAREGTWWGYAAKQYVESVVYIGILPLVLAGVGVVRGAIARMPITDGFRRTHALFFSGYAVACVLFMFGTAAYAILYYGLPGVNQLHSPYRWSFPFTICLIVLAAAGLEWLRDQPRLASWLGRACAAAGALSVIGVIAARALWNNGIAERIGRAFANSQMATERFPDAQTFFSYIGGQFALFGLIVLTCGIVLLSFRRSARVALALCAIAVLGDLTIAWRGFSPAVDPSLLTRVPPAIAALTAQRPSDALAPWRVTSYEPDNGAHFKPANANMLMAHGIQDIRGYDSIIPRQYADYMRAIEPQGDLLYNRISPIRQRASLESPLLDLLNVRYVLSEDAIDVPGIERRESFGNLALYENTRAAPRAYTMPDSALAAMNGTPFSQTIQRIDPRTALLVDACPIAACPAQPTPATPNADGVAITVYRANDVWIDVDGAAGRDWLVLTDSHFPGWRAYVRQRGAPDNSEREVPIMLVNGNFRGVRIADAAAGDTGALTVRFRYAPDSVRFGAFISVLGLVSLLFAGGVYAWRTYAVDADRLSGASRVVRNSAVLAGMNILGRLISFASAIVIARLIGAEGVGAYANAVVLIGPFDIVMNFGLNTWLTRQVAQDRANASAYFNFTTTLRLLIAACIAPLLLALALIGLSVGYFSQELALVLAILGFSQVISSINAGLTALFFAYERGEIPAALSLFGAILTASIGVGLLSTGMGLRALAITSILVNVITLSVLSWQARGTLGVRFARSGFKVRETRGELLKDALPLMLNHLIPAIEYKLDVPLIKAATPPAVLFGSTPVKQDAVAGWYYTGYRYIDAFNIIPSFFTQSFFPAMSRLATKEGDALGNALTLATKLLVMIALPLAVATTFLSTWMAGVFGADFLPHSAVALSIVAWSMAAGWINSLTNYALIAAGQQAKLTRAFVITLIFNAIANLLFIPPFSYIGAAVVTIASEIVKGAVFYYFVRKHIAPLRWTRILAWPALCAGLMAAISGAIIASTGQTLLGVLLGGAAYLGTSWFGGALSTEERDAVRALLRRGR